MNTEQASVCLIFVVIFHESAAIAHFLHLHIHITHSYIASFIRCALRIVFICAKIVGIHVVLISVTFGTFGIFIQSWNFSITTLRFLKREMAALDKIIGSECEAVFILRHLFLSSARRALTAPCKID